MESPTERASGQDRAWNALLSAVLFAVYLAGIRSVGAPASLTAEVCTYAITGTAAALLLRFGWAAVPGLIIGVCVFPLRAPGPLDARILASIVVLVAPIVTVGALRGGTRFEPDLSRASNVAWLAPAAFVNALIAVGPISALVREHAGSEPVAFGHIFLSHIASIALFAPVGMLYPVARRRLRPVEVGLGIAGVVTLAILAVSAFTPSQSSLPTIVAILVVAAVLSVLLGIRLGVHIAVIGNVVVLTTAGIAVALRPSVFDDGTAEIYWTFVAGNSVVTLTVASVIHARDRIEERLRFSDFALYNVGQAILLFDSESRVRYANRAACHLYGYSAPALERLSQAELSANWTEAEWRSSWLRLTRSRSHQWDATAIHKDGSAIPVRMTSNGIIFDGDELVCCFIEDLRREREQQAQLLESERTFRALFEESPIAIQRFDARGNLLQINKAVAKLWGLPSTDAPNYNILSDDGLPPEIRRVAERAFAGEIIQSEPAVLDQREALKYGSEAERWLQTWYYPLRDENEEIVEVIVAVFDVTSERNAQKELASARALLDAVFENLPLGAYAYARSSGRVMLWNKAAEELYGVGMEGVTRDGLAVLDSIVRDVTDAPSHARTGSQLGTLVHEQLVEPEGKEERIVLSRQVPIEQPDEMVVLTLAEDVTEQRRFEDRIRESEARYRAVVEHQTELIARARIDGPIVFANEAYARFVDSTPEQVVAQNIRPGYRPEEIARIIEARKELKPGEFLDDVTLEVISGPGTGRTLRWTVIPLFDAEGEIVETLGVARDVTEELRAKEELELSEMRYRAVVEHQSELIARATLDGQLIFANEAFARFVGATPEEVVEKNIWPAYEPAAIEKVFEQRRSLRPGEVLDGVVLDVVDGPGKGRTLVWTLTPYFDSEGTLIETLGVARDVTDEMRAQRELEQSEARYRAVVEHQTELIARATAAGQLLFVNEAFARFVQSTPDDVVAENLWPGYRPDDLARVMEAKGKLEPGATLEDVHLEVVEGPGAGRVVAWTITPIFDADGHQIEMLGVGRDVTERLRAQRKLEQSEARYRAVVEDQTEYIARVDMNGRLLLVNDAFCRLVGENRHRVIEENIWPSYESDSLERTLAELAETVTPDNPVHVSELRLTSGPKSGSWLNWTARGIFDEKGILVEINAVGRDVTERRRYQDQLLFNATHDALTGLPNRSALTAQLERMMETVSVDKPVACFFLDLDRFKLINDTLGHQAGDELLNAIAGRIRGVIDGVGGFVARLGGDEFVALVRNGADSRPRLIRLAEEIVRVVTRPERVAGGEDVFVGVSIGIAEVRETGERPEDVIRHADMAMYRAKRDVGQHSYAFYERALEASAVARLNVQRDLVQAFRRHELRVYFQPIVRLDDGTVHGLEVLVRWEHPERGLILPGEFLPVAEETHQIIELGWWVLDETLRVCTTWLAAGLDVPTLSVNLSPRQFADPELIPRLRALLAERDLSIDQIAFEITEEAFIHPDSVAAENIVRLGELGGQLHVDDFGTGYSSLSYLHRLPANTLKIDRSFIGGLNEGETAPIIESIVHLGHGLKKAVIAEGVETPEQQAWLLDHGCVLGQGYLFHRPLSEADTRRLLSSRGSR